MKGKTICLFWLIVLSAIPVCADNEIILAVPEFSPYSYSENGRILGSGVARVKEILERLSMPFKLKAVPNYGRALLETELGRVDGFFLASRNAERDTVAVFSKAVIYNRWSWFLPTGARIVPGDPVFKKQATIGTCRYTNTHNWLKINGYHNIEDFDSADLLPKLIASNRLDAVFLSEVVFLRSARDNHVSSKAYQVIEAVVRPFGLYISKTYLVDHPGFMQRLNTAIEEHGLAQP